MPQTLAPNLFMLILTIFNHETAPPWTGRTGIPPLHILMTGKKILLLKCLFGTGCLTSTPKVIYSAIFFYSPKAGLLLFFSSPLTAKLTLTEWK